MKNERRKFWMALNAVVVLLLLVAIVGPPLLARYLRPMAREKAVEILEERFDDVELEELDLSALAGLSLVPSLTAVGKGLSISLPGHPEAPPFISMAEFEVQLSALGLLRDPVRIDWLRMDELRIQIPTGGNEDDDDGPEAGGDPPPAFLVEELVADGAVLRILPGDPEGEPQEYVLHELEVRSAGLGEPMQFTTRLENAKPPGEIDAEGTFGPLELSRPGSSPVSASYVFEDADLSVFGGIAGTLRSEGEFDGVLARIEVSGFTETPEFQLTSAGNPVELRTEFHAVVDGTAGDTFLVPVEAILESSRFHTEGGVSERPGTEGKTVCVDAEGDGNRIEDFLRLAMKSDAPVMTGDLRFRSLVMIPPGEIDVAKKLVLDGEFAIDRARFPDRGVQGKVDTLSNLGRGAAGRSEDRGGDDPEDDRLRPLREERVFSNLRGAFELESGVLTLSYVSFDVPGASVSMRGTYGLLDEALDFRGELRLDAKLSETTSGIKSFLLKLIDPLFERDDAGAVLPVKVTGSPDHPRFGIDVARTLTKQETDASPPPVGEDGWTKSIPSCVEILSLSPEAMATGAEGVEKDATTKRRGKPSAHP